MSADLNSSPTMVSLLHATTINDQHIVEVADAALKSSTPEPSALATKVVALLRLDRFADALHALAEAESDADETCRLAKCYALYKTGDSDAAYAVARLSPGRGYSHIAAQLAYRDEKFRHASGIYVGLTSSSSVGAAEEESDLVINSLAVTAQRNWQGADVLTGPHITSPTGSESFELLYNMACCTLSQGNFLKALTLLRLAARLCSTSEDISERERRAEMVPILIQKMYTYFRLGDQVEGQGVFNQLLSYGYETDEIEVVMENNCLALRAQRGNVFSDLRQFERTLGVFKGVQLFQHQTKRLERNKFALAFLAQKYSGVVQKSRYHLEKSSSPEALVSSVINAAALSLQRCGTLSLREILAMTTVRPSDIGPALLTIQLYASFNQTAGALSTLRALFARLEERNDLDTRFAPGLVALAVKLYGLGGRVRCLRSELCRASSYWNKQDRTPRIFLRKAGVELLRSPDTTDRETAGANFERIHEHTAEDPKVIAGLVASCATVHKAQAERFTNQLPAAADFIKGLNIQNLVHGSVILVSPYLAATEKHSRGVGFDRRTYQRKSKKGSAKNFEEGMTLDPERWLPLRDRSLYRSKEKRSKRKVENAQGGIIMDNETFGVMEGPGVANVEESNNSLRLPYNKKKKGKK